MPPSILFNVGMCRGMEYTMVSTIFVVPFSAPVIFLASVAEHADETCTTYFLMCMWVALLLLVIFILLFALPLILPIILLFLSFLHRHSILILLILLLPVEDSTTILKAILHNHSCTNRKPMIEGTMPPWQRSLAKSRHYLLPTHPHSSTRFFDLPVVVKF